MTTGIVSIGECMIELSQPAPGQWQLSYGGDCYNTAIYLTRLGQPTTFLTALGCDPFSADMRRQWQAEGIDTSLILTMPGQLPGLYAIRTDPAGEREFYYWREQAAVRALFTLKGIEGALDQARAARLLYLSGITLSLFDAEGRAQIVRLARDVRERGGDVAFDPNYRARGWPDSASARAAIDSLAPFVTIAFPTHLDEHYLHGDSDAAATVRRWQRYGTREIVVKTGAGGCLLSDDDGVCHTVVPSHPVEVIDTTGAGDSFNAGYLAARLVGASGSMPHGGVMIWPVAS